MTTSNEFRHDRGFSDRKAVPAAMVVATDFRRRVYCILGLPFDAMTLEEAQAKLAEAIECQRRCFFSTPNLNFIIGCLQDAKFRDSVIRSDLSFVDGMPIIWIAWTLGIPVRTRVAGSTLFEQLRKKTLLPIKVFFFGGLDGVAHQAGTLLNISGGSMSCVGTRSPGFGTIDGMSTDALIDEINDAQPDLLVVALGAKRGQAWIEHNLVRLKTPLVTHLGAVVNFVAGTVARAPAWIAELGLEWLWRIKEEPALWRRYMGDGFALLNLLCTRVIPGALSAAWFRSRRAHNLKGNISVSTEGNRCRITMRGSWHDNNLLPLRETLEMITESRCHILLDLEKVTSLDSACVGLLILLFGHQSKIKRGFTMSAMSPVVERVLRLCCAEYLMAPATVDRRQVKGRMRI